MTYYGQSKPPEDAIAAAVFGDFVGTCVEVGAYNGIDLSNTYHFYLKGWTCINFEPHPDNYAALERNQPNALNFQYAVIGGDRPAPKTMEMQTAPGKPIVTGFNLPGWYIDSEVAGGRNGLAAIRVPITTLNTILSNHHIQSVDYISIDTDGTEMSVLDGFDFNAYRPRLMIIEYNHALTEMTSYLKSYGYQLAYDNGLNGFWVRTQADCDAVIKATR